MRLTKSDAATGLSPDDILLDIASHRASRSVISPECTSSGIGLGELRSRKNPTIASANGCNLARGIINKHRLLNLVVSSTANKEKIGPNGEQKHKNGKCVTGGWKS